MSEGKKIAIIDYKLGNLFSVRQACVYLGYDAVVTSEKDEVMKADFAILPGVGAFGDAMNNLERLDLVSPIKDYIQAGRPLMGVCLGLQLLFTESEEFGSHKGLNLIEGTVKKFPPKKANDEILKVPQIEWNNIRETADRRWEATPLGSCRSGDYMYFVHSFFVQPQSPNAILSVTTYGETTYCSSVLQGNIFACQFHPEKSGHHGVEIYKNWLTNYSINK